MLGDADAVRPQRRGDLLRAIEVDALVLPHRLVVSAVLAAVGDGDQIGEDAPRVEPADEIQSFFHRGKFARSLDLAHLGLEPEIRRDVHGHVARGAEIVPVVEMRGVDGHRRPALGDDLAHLRDRLHHVIFALDAVMIDVHGEDRAVPQFPGILHGIIDEIAEIGAAVIGLRFGDLDQHGGVVFFGGAQHALGRERMTGVRRQHDRLVLLHGGENIAAAEQSHIFAFPAVPHVQGTAVESLAVKFVVDVHLSDSF